MAGWRSWFATAPPADVELPRFALTASAQTIKLGRQQIMDAAADDINANMTRAGWRKA